MMHVILGHHATKYPNCNNNNNNNNNNILHLIAFSLSDDQWAAMILSVVAMSFTSQLNRLVYLYPCMISASSLFFFTIIIHYVLSSQKRLRILRCICLKMSPPPGIKITKVLSAFMITLSYGRHSG